MTARDGKPCKRCGTREWNKWNQCVQCRRDCQKKRYHADPKTHNEVSRRWREENKERARDGYRKWASENKAKIAEKTARWNRNNPERRRELSKRSAENNREKSRQASARWQRENPKANVARVQRYRARKNGGGGSYTSGEWVDLCNRYNNRCLCCGRSEVKLTVDHVVPLDKGGSNDISNIQPLCFDCNRKKHTKTIDYRPDTGILGWIQSKLFG